MRLLAIVLLILALAAPAYGQENTTAQDNATTDANTTVTDGNTTADGDNATPPDATETPAETPSEPEPAGPPAPIEIVIEGLQEGSAVFFRGPDGKRNPTLNVQPGQEVTFRFKSIAGVHNLNIAGLAKTPLLSDGDEATLVWTAPTETGRVEYWCDPHKSAGMKGTIQVGSAAPSGGGGEEGTITGETIDLGQYDPACAGKVAPAIVTTGIVGSPTLEDYIAGCQPQTGTQETVSHPVDLVIPISWALIALGIGGVVWVHKYYKP